MKRSLPLAVLLLFAPVLAAAQRGPSDRPNFVVYITDDESWLERSAYGWSKLPTPNFDRVAKEGVLFTHGYTSAPSCAPSRASLLTGRNFWELEEGAFIQAWLPAKFAVLPDLMEAGGYHAGYTGKGWGPGVMDNSGRRRNPAGNVYNSVKRKVREPGIYDADYAGNFEKFLTERKPGQPFWFWVGSVEPHTPHDPKNYEKIQQKYGVPPGDIKVPEFLPDTPGVHRSRANMLYEVRHADDDLGRILQLLEKHGELENTLLIVTADNGTQVLRSKTNLYDWGVRVPMAIMWPGRVRGGRQVDDFVNFIDLAPTILEAAGLPVPREMSGRSILRSILLASGSGRVDPTRGWTASGIEWHGELAPISLAARMIRDERYHYIVNYSRSPRRVLSPERRRPDSEYDRTIQTADEILLIEAHPEHPAVKRYVEWFQAPRPAEELYDCQTDPWQLKNLAALPEYLAIKARLKAQLELYQRQTNDPRITGEMEVFDRTRAFVEKRKATGYVR